MYSRSEDKVQEFDLSIAEYLPLHKRVTPPSLGPSHKAAFQLHVFLAHVYARKTLNLSKFYTSSDYLNKYKLNHAEN